MKELSKRIDNSNDFSPFMSARKLNSLAEDSDLGAANDMKTWGDYTAGVMETFAEMTYPAWYAKTKVRQEAAEFSQILTKYICHGKNIEYDKLIEEAGDTLYYLAATQQIQDIYAYDGIYEDASFNAIPLSGKLEIADEEALTLITELLQLSPNIILQNVKIVVDLVCYGLSRLKEDPLLIYEIDKGNLLRFICIQNKIKLMRRHGTTYNKSFYQGNK